MEVEQTPSAAIPSVSTSSSHQLSLLTTLSGHTDRVWHLSWSPSEPLLASCSSDKSVRLYSYSPSPSPPTLSYKFQFASAISSAHDRTVRSLSFSPTGTTLATASFDATVGIWQQVSEAGVEDGAFGGQGEWESLDPLEGHESECKSVAWSADGRLLASCSRDKSVWVWESVGPSEFECLAVLMEHTQDVKMVSWHPEEELLASASYDDTVKLYAADPYDDDWSCIATFPHTATVWAISFSPCGNYLVSAGDDLILRIWGRDPADLPEIGIAGEAKREEGGRMGPWSKSGVRIGIKEKWNWELKAEIEGVHERTVYSVDWGKGGLGEEEGGLGRILSAGGDGKINVFQITKPAVPTEPPLYSLIASVESAHGVSDVNHAAWCKISPAKAAETLRALEGGEGDEDEEDQKMSGSVEEDSRWKGHENMFASAGDDGLVNVFVVEPTSS